MENFKKLIREAHLGNPLNEDKYLSNKDSYIKISEPSFRKDKNNPNFLSAYINYDMGPGVGIALGKETMAGQIRRLSSQEAVRQMEIIARKLNDSFDIEDIEVTDLENGVVELFAVSDDFIDMDPRSELSMAMLGENQKYDDEDIVIYDGEEHVIMSGNPRDDDQTKMIDIRPLEDSAILGKRDVIKVPARALAYKSDLDKMYDEYKPKDELDENEKYDHIARAEYGKPWTLLSIAQKQEMLSVMNRETEKEFETDFERRRKGDYSDDMEDGMTDYERSRMDEDMNDPVLMKARAAQMKRDKIEADEEDKQAYLDKKYGKNFMDKLEAEIVLKQQIGDLKDEREQIMIDMEQEAEPEGGEIADEYGSRLNDIDSRMELIQKDIDDLRMYESVNEDLDIGHQDDEPSMLKSELARAGQMIQMLYRAVDKYDDIEGEVDFPQWWQAKIIKANTLLDSAFDYLAGEEDVAKIDAMIDRIDDDMTEGNGGADQDDAQLSLNVSSDAALNTAVAGMGPNESLKKSLKEALNKRLSKK